MVLRCAGILKPGLSRDHFSTFDTHIFVLQIGEKCRDVKSRKPRYDCPKAHIKEKTTLAR